MVSMQQLSFLLFHPVELCDQSSRLHHIVKTVCDKVTLAYTKPLKPESHAGPYSSPNP